MNLLAQTAREPYYPGFRDLNLWVVGVCLLALLYFIAIAATGQRVRTAKNRMKEIDLLLADASITSEQRSKLERDREEAQRDYSVLTAAGPGRWFR